MRAVRFHDYGSPAVLRVDEVPVPQPGPGQLLVRVTAAGIGFADVQIRAGLMRQTALPICRCRSRRALRWRAPWRMSGPASIPQRSAGGW